MISPLYLSINPNEILFHISPEGLVNEAVYKPRIFSNALDDIYFCLKPGRPVSDLFGLPVGKSIRELITAPQKEIPETPEYPNLAGVFQFEGAQEEFHSALPLAMLRLVGLPDEQVLGVIRLSNFFARLSTILHRQPLFCADHEERITGYNRAFALLFPGEAQSSLLNRSLGKLMDPTPAAIQKAESEIQSPVPESGWQTRHEQSTIPWSTRAGKKALFKFPTPVNLAQTDIRVRFEIESGGSLPSLILGEVGDYRPEYSPDLDGYLFGPDSEQSRILLKKQGDTAFISAPLALKKTAGIYEYIKIGCTFRLLRAGKEIVAYHDFEGLARKECRVYLYLREGESARIRSATLSLMDRDRPIAVVNRFITLINGRKQQCLIERLPANVGPNQALRSSTFLLRDMSDVRRAMEDLERNYRQAVEREQEAVKSLRAYRSAGEEFVAVSKPILLVKALAEKAAATHSTLLIQGETGTGKEVLARFIHGKSLRTGGPFTHVDCSTVPASLLESMLFGHEKGSFTGATGANPGLFHQADKGTLFIDEIHNLSMDVQAKLLRFLEDHTIIPVGGSKPVKLDVRVILATNVNLKQMVEEGRFRQDLYYRIAVIVLQLPPLRDRSEDIPSLAGHFLEGFNRKYGKAVKGLTPGAYRLLYGYDWPGNIRELRNVLERAFVFCEKTEIGEDLISLSEPVSSAAIKPGRPGKTRKPGRAIRCTTQEMTALLKKHQGYILKVAEELRVTRQTLYVFMRKHGLRPEEYR